jgi:hypothetical protein
VIINYSYYRPGRIVQVLREQGETYSLLTNRIDYKLYLLYIVGVYNLPFIYPDRCIQLWLAGMRDVHL